METRVRSMVWVLILEINRQTHNYFNVKLF